MTKFVIGKLLALVIVLLLLATCHIPAIDSAMLLALVSCETDFAEFAAIGRRPTIPTMQKAKMPSAITTSIKLKAEFFMVSSFRVLSFECDLCYGLPQ